MKTVRLYQSFFLFFFMFRFNDCIKERLAESIDFVHLLLTI